MVPLHRELLLSQIQPKQGRRRSGIRYKPLMLLALEISCESSKVAVVIYKELLVGLNRDWFVEV